MDTEVVKIFQDKNVKTVSNNLHYYKKEIIIL